jgi:dTDP-4-amino-4,6-dideoxygalactose transaminase
MIVPFVDLKKQYQNHKNDIDISIKRVIEETAFIQGKYVNKFEIDFAKKYGMKHCISVANGTDSLFIIMKMLGINKGDEVITVANSWISTSETISMTGAKPVFVDIDPEYYTIDENKIDDKINEKTKLIIPVHLYGQSCDMEKIMLISKKYKIPVLEDCAQSHFSEFNGKLVGSFGIASSFSFYPGKNLGAYGDAGCVLTNDDILAKKIRMFSRHGALEKHNHIIEGINSRLDGIQASILLSKLPHILEWSKNRLENAKLYIKELSSLKELVLPVIRPSTKHTFHLFVIRAEKRDSLKKYLMENEIQTAIHYPVTLPNMPAYKYLNHKKNDFPISTKYQNQILSLPMYAELSKTQILYVCEKIKLFYK